MKLVLLSFDAYIILFIILNILNYLQTVIFVGHPVSLYKYS